MAEPTVEQQRAIALASARLRLQDQQPSAAEQVANDPVTKGAQAVLDTSPADLAAANPAVRLGMGAISPILGAAQLGAEALGNKSFTEYIKNLDEMKQRGVAAMGDSPAGDVANAVGTGAEVAGNFLGFSPLSKIAPAASIAGKVGQGVLIGAGAGATTPTTSEDYWGSKGGQVLLGTVVGGAIPVGIEAGKAVAKGGKNIFDMFTQEGAKNILSKYQRQIIGDKGVPEVIAALRSSSELIPGSKPTAAEALVGTPSGSPIAAHERITAVTPGGVSAQFGQRKLDQFAAMEEAIKQRKIATDPMRETALDAANQGGVKTSGIQDKIDAMLKEPGKGASDLVQKVLTSVKEKLASLTDKETGNIDARDLYTVRKEIGNTVQLYSKETSNWDKRLSAGLEKDVQKSIDDAIEKAGGTGWRKYLNEFASRTDAMEQDLARRKAALRPAQKTDLAGGADVAGQMRVHGPQMLSRPMMVTNYILKRMGESVEKRIDPEAARRYLDPQALATELEKFSPAMKRTIVQDMIRIGKLPAIGTSGSEAANAQP